MAAHPRATSGGTGAQATDLGERDRARVGDVAVEVGAASEPPRHGPPPWGEVRGDGRPGEGPRGARPASPPRRGPACPRPPPARRTRGPAARTPPPRPGRSR